MHRAAAVVRCTARSTSNGSSPVISTNGGGAPVPADPEEGAPEEVDTEEVDTEELIWPSCQSGPTDPPIANRRSHTADHDPPITDVQPSYRIAPGARTACTPTNW